jgi:hypothetical protein
VNRINSTQACNSRIAFRLPVHPYECFNSVTTKRISMQILAFTPVYFVSINSRLEFQKIMWKQVLIFHSCLTWKYRVLISSDNRNFPPLLHRVCRRPGVCIVNTTNESTESGNRQLSGKKMTLHMNTTSLFPPCFLYLFTSCCK